jgi:hypothetical protein
VVEFFLIFSACINIKDGLWPSLMLFAADLRETWVAVRDCARQEFVFSNI